MFDERVFYLGYKDRAMSIVIDDYVDFSNGNRNEVIVKVMRGRKIAEGQWKEIVRKGSIEEVGKFYTISDFHYDILLPYLRPEKYNKGERYREVIDFVRSVDGDRVMEFGGGPGQLCLLLYYNTSKDITYVDLPSKIMDFAKWRAKKYNADIEFIEAETNHCSLPRETYDIVISDATLEHVPDVDKTVSLISESLKPGGYFYLFFDDIEEDVAMHISSHIDIDRILKKNRLERITGPIWIKE